MFEGRGATAKLRVFNFRIIAIVIQFFQEVERMGGRKLHLKCVARMIPLVHVSLLIYKISVLTSAKYDQIKICDKEKFQEFTEIVTSHSGDQTLMRAMTTF